MKKEIISALILVIIIHFFSFTAIASENKNVSPSDILGLWISSVREKDGIKKGTSLVTEIFEKDAKYYAYGFAYIGSSEGTEILKDIHNPDPQYRNRSLSETVFLHNLEFDGNSWKNGRIYRVYDGKTFYAKAHLSKDFNTLIVKASIDSLGVMGKSFEWHRITDPAMLKKYNAMRSDKALVEKSIPSIQ